MTGLATPPRAGRREWIALGVIALPNLVYAMDLTVLFLAVPAITKDLRPSSTERLWIAAIWAAYRAYLQAVVVASGLLSGADPSVFHTLGAWRGGALVATAIAFDHDGDCCVFNMSTIETERRHGLGTALTTASRTRPEHDRGLAAPDPRPGSAKPRR
jgi:hypothetical protein